MISGPAAAPTIVSATPPGRLHLITNLREEIDLEGHVESIRHNEIGGDRHRRGGGGGAIGLFTRHGGCEISSLSSDCFGQHGYGPTHQRRRNNQVIELCYHVFYSVWGGLEVCFEAICRG